MHTRTLALLCLGLSICAWLLGGRVGRSLVVRERLETTAARVADLEQNAIGIAVESPFPELTLWTIETDSALAVSQLLPSGGFLLCVSPGCDQCVQASLDLVRLIESGHGVLNSAIIVTDKPDGSLELLTQLQNAGISYPVVCDVTGSLRSEYGIRENPALIVLEGAELLVTRIGVYDRLLGFRFNEPS